MEGLTDLWIEQFQAACMSWQQRLGLTDWAITFKVEPSTDLDEAAVDYNCVNRSACITAYTDTPDRLPPGRVALHEMLHLVLADFAYVAVHRTNESDPDLEREEHRAIERLLNVMDGALA